jgi:AraC-like DNA-binding protein
VLCAIWRPRLAQALGLLHAQPERPWTIDELAAAVHVSRATLVRRSNDLVGEPPATYLARWRMELAVRLLRESEQPVGSISHRVGYTSEFALSRAPSKHRGEPPSHYRKRIKKSLGA